MKYNIYISIRWLQIKNISLVFEKYSIHIDDKYQCFIWTIYNALFCNESRRWENKKKCTQHSSGFFSSSFILQNWKKENFCESNKLLAYVTSCNT